MELRLRLRTVGPEKLVLAFPIWARIVFAAIAAIPLYGMVRDGTVYAVPMILLVVSLLAVLYNESWIFDAHEQVAESRFGLLFVFKRRRFAFDEIEAFELEEFQKGSVPRGGTTKSGGAAERGGGAADDAGLGGTPMDDVGSGHDTRRGRGLIKRKHLLALTMVLKSGERHRIETESRRGELAGSDNAKAIAQFCDKPLLEKS